MYLTSNPLFENYTALLTIYYFIWCFFASKLSSWADLVKDKIEYFAFNVIKVIRNTQPKIVCEDYAFLIPDSENY